METICGARKHNPQRRLFESHLPWLTRLSTHTARGFRVN